MSVEAVADVTGFAASLIHTFSSLTTFAAVQPSTQVGRGVDVTTIGGQTTILVNTTIDGFRTFGTVRIDASNRATYDLTLDAANSDPVAFTGQTTLSTPIAGRVEERGSWQFVVPGDFQYRFDGTLRYPRPTSNLFTPDRYPTGLLLANLRYTNGATFQPTVDFDGTRFADIGILGEAFTFDLATGELF
ncbi:MAG TPA: hypothetical protein VEI97_15215 [bacterium]|nr:hypothetical protein [bacterium]